VAQIIDFNLVLAAAPRSISFDEAERRFMELAASIGIDTRDINSFGPTDDVVRVDTIDDKRGKRSGWYCIHEEAGLLYGVLGNWKTGEQTKFYGRDERQIDVELLATMRIKQQIREREAAEIKRKNAAEAAEMIRFCRSAQTITPTWYASGSSQTAHWSWDLTYFCRSMTWTAT